MSRSTELHPAPADAPTAAPDATAQVDTGAVSALLSRISTRPWERTAALSDAVAQHPHWAPSLTATAVKASGAHFIPELIVLAVRIAPNHAPAIVRAAVLAAPLMSPAIAAAAVQEASSRAQEIADAACSVAPAFSRQIQLAVVAMSESQRRVSA